MSKEYQDINSKQTILQHGEGVCSKFIELLEHLESSAEDEYCHPIPKWLTQYNSILLPIIQSNKTDIETYLFYHDCGKSFCLEIDNEGKRHFPNHEIISKHTFLKYSSNIFIADLIGKDMLCHLTKAKDFQKLIDEEHIEILLFSSLAELHSNALMFGGFQSDSFKIKFKNLEKLGQRILDSKYGRLKPKLKFLTNN